MFYLTLKSFIKNLTGLESTKLHTPLWTSIQEIQSNQTLQTNLILWLKHVRVG